MKKWLGDLFYLLSFLCIALGLVGLGGMLLTLILNPTPYPWAHPRPWDFVASLLMLSFIPAFIFYKIYDYLGKQ